MISEETVLLTSEDSLAQDYTKHPIYGTTKKNKENFKDGNTCAKKIERLSEESQNGETKKKLSKAYYKIGKGESDLQRGKEDCQDVKTGKGFERKPESDESVNDDQNAELDLENETKEKLKEKEPCMDFNNNYERDSDSEFDTDLESDEEIPNNYLDEQRAKYLSACKKFGVPPVTTLLNGLSKRVLKLSHHGLGAAGVKSIVAVLKSNTCIIEVDLSDNNLDEEATKTISRMIRENLYIADLNLSFNILSNPGLDDLINSIKFSSNIKHMKLSRTGLKDRHVLLIADLIRDNNFILTLVLSHNEFSASSGLHLGPAISLNTRIRTLDLSWNHLRNEGAVAIGNAMRHNNSITCLNIAWNGFADSGAEALGKAFQVNSALVEVDLSHNRVTEKGGSFLGAGLRCNSSLKILKLNWNPLKTEGVQYLIDGIRKNDSSALVELQLNGVVIDHACKSAVEEIQARRPGIKIDVGGVTSSGPMFTNVNQLRREIVDIIAAYLAKHRLRMLDLFNQWDKDKSLTLTRNEFRKGIKDCKIPITEMQLNFMLDWLDQDGNDEIEYNEFVSITQVE